MIVCAVCVAVPLSEIDCVAFDTFRLLSVTSDEPLRAPAVTGPKLMGNRQEAPAASDPAVEELALTSGQAVDPLLLRLKFAEMLGLFPVEGIGMLSVELPMFASVTICGLSLLMEPADVVAKVREGGSVKSNFAIVVLP